MPGLKIKRLTPGATIQDQGRAGFRRFGVTQGGAMDQFALAEGRSLLANPPDAAALELTGGGGVFQSIGDNLIACTGGEMAVAVSGQRKRWRHTIGLADGETLEIGASLEGYCGYLHLPGGIDSPKLLGSRSAHAQAGLGWIPKAGEILLPLAEPRAAPGLRLPQPEYHTARTIRIMAGPQSKLFSKADHDALCGAEFRVTNARNRVGMRLHSSAGKFRAELGTTLPSDAIVAGDIQVAADGIAAVLLADCQPVGGYPRIATVISADLRALAQMPTGASFRMTKVSRERALKALAELRSEIASLPGAVAPSVRNPADMNDLLSYSLIAGVVRGDEQDAN